MGESTKKPPRSNRIAVDLKDLHNPWLNWCAQRQLVPSDAVRRVIRRVIEGSAGSEFVPHPSDFEVHDDERWKRVEIRLTETEHLALKGGADQEGMSVPRWLAGLVRLQLTGEQQFGPTEIEALRRSSQLLLALGRNINQIAYNMNQRVDKDELTLAQIEYVASFIKEHTQAVSAVLLANGKRWRR